MTVFSRITTGFALGCLLASSIVAPVTGSEVKARHARQAARSVKGHNSNARRAAGKANHCKAPGTTTTTLAATTATTTPSVPTTTTAVATTTKAQPAPAKTTSAPAPADNGDCMWGYGWTEMDVNIAPFRQGVCWCYTWSPYGCDDENILEVIPMLWGAKQTGEWESEVAGKYFKHVLMMNEPEEPASATSVEDAVSMYWQYFDKGNFGTIVSPAVTAASLGTAWITEFFKQCSTCRIGVLAIHVYTVDINIFKSQVAAMHAIRPDLPIWITEYGCVDYSGAGKYPSQSEVNTFMAETQAWIQQQGYIQRAGWYGIFKQMNVPDTNRLMSEGGDPTDLFWQYSTHQ